MCQRNEFDFVIVGAGTSAMGLLYGLLESFKESEPPFTIAVIEKGGAETDPTTTCPHEWYRAAHAKRSSSATQIPVEMTGGRITDLPMGFGLGGTSNINACLCTPPKSQDLDVWPKNWKKSILSSIKKIQTQLEVNQVLDMGSANVSSPFKEKGSIEFSSGVPILTSRSASENMYVRRNYYDGFLQPFLEQFPHLQQCITWFLGSRVERILIDKKTKRATGVVLLGPLKENIILNSSRELILCAGAIETPALLLVSGVKLEGVGKHLKDQILIARTFASPFRWTSLPASKNGISALGHLHCDKEIFQVALVDSMTGIDNIVPSAVAMVFRRQVSQNVPLSRWFNVWFRALFCTVKMLLEFLIKFSPVGIILRRCTTTALIFLMHPVSEGFVSIKAREDKDKDVPIENLSRSDMDLSVNIGYLKDQRDVDAMKRGWHACTDEITQMEIFPSWILKRVFGLFSFGDWFPWYLNKFSQPYYHYCGTCAMKLEQGRDDWVVDEDLQLRQHQKLKICDASIFPSTLSNPPALACVALGYGLGQNLASSNTNRKR